MALDTTRLGAWATLPFFADNLADVEAALDANDRIILPPPHQVFAALERTQPDATRVVILGQDPYPTAGHAHGFAFSAEPHVTPLPKSLANIYRELEADLGRHPPNADLRFWADQGVLLLNAVLTVPEGDANGHAKIGWQTLTGQVLSALDQAPRAFLLWGRKAQRLAERLENGDHLTVASAHPSPLSAHQGFFGSRPFSRINAWLASRNQPPINWTTPE